MNAWNNMDDATSKKDKQEAMQTTKKLRCQAQVNKQEDIQGHLPDSHVKRREAGKHTLRLGPPSQGRDERQAAAEPGS